MGQHVPPKAQRVRQRAAAGEGGRRGDDSVQGGGGVQRCAARAGRHRQVRSGAPASLRRQPLRGAWASSASRGGDGRAFRTCKEVRGLPTCAARAQRLACLQRRRQALVLFTGCPPQPHSHTPPPIPPPPNPPNPKPQTQPRLLHAVNLQHAESAVRILPLLQRELRRLMETDEFAPTVLPLAEQSSELAAFSVRSRRRCSACRVARYCSEQCQRADWGAGHRALCRALAAGAGKVVAAAAADGAGA